MDYVRLAPHDLAISQYDMSREYAERSTELGQIEKGKALAWLEFRKDTKTDKEADRIWEASTPGQRSTELRFLLKGMEKQMSSAKALLKTLSDESHGQY